MSGKASNRTGSSAPTSLVVSSNDYNEEEWLGFDGSDVNGQKHNAHPQPAEEPPAQTVERGEKKPRKMAQRTLKAPSIEGDKGLGKSTFEALNRVVDDEGDGESQ